jgi:glycosyltransferase involved in cell wall biosynthesis
MSDLTIVTVCKGRLAHLKQTLPSFVAQKQTEVIVVDYDCPEGTAEYVAKNYPGTKVVKVENRPHFNNWEARNIGAKQAASDLIAFVDADVLLASNFADWVTKNLETGCFGKMPSALVQSRHGEAKLSESSNRLEGLLVMPTRSFTGLGGYDDILEGWGAGGDLDLVDRLSLRGSRMILLPEELVEKTIDHSSADRTRFHKMNVANSHLVGVLYRVSKNSLMRIFGRDLQETERQRLYALARNASAHPIAPKTTKVDLLVISKEVEGSNYRIEQTITTKVTWSN